MNPTFSIRQAQVSLSAARPVRVSKMLVQQGTPPHDHDYYEICLVADGRATHYTSTYRAPLGRGSLLAVPPGAVHGFSDIDGFMIRNVYYLAEWLLSDLRVFWDQTAMVPLFLAATLFRLPADFEIPQFSLNEAEMAQSLRELEDLEIELMQKNPSILFLKSTLLKFLITASRAYARTHPRRNHQPFRREVWHALESVEECLQESKAFRVFELAARLRLSEDHLSRLFRRATGRTLTDYYQQRRVHVACSLLLNPEPTITDVVYSLGYSDSAHFCRLFKRYTGQTPRAWRSCYVEPPQ